VDGLARAGDARHVTCAAEKRLARQYPPLLALNRDIMLRSLLLQLCFGALTVFGARLGPEIVAVNAVLMTLLTFTAYALDGFAYAVEAHSGQAYGARESGNCRMSGGRPAVRRGWWRWRLRSFTPALVSILLRCSRHYLRCVNWQATTSSGR
jgi:hypothetical protein